MFSLSNIIRNRCLHSAAPLQLKKLLSSTTSKDGSGSSSDSSGSSSDSSDDEREMSKPTKNAEAVKKLNLLLQSMAKEEKSSPASGLGQQLARPKARIKVKEESTDGDLKETKIKVSADPLGDAAKEVAKSLGGDAEKTESELLAKLRSPPVNDDPSAPKTSLNLSELIVGMKIDRTPKTPPVEAAEGGRAQQVRNILGSQQRVQQMQNTLRSEQRRAGKPRESDLEFVRERKSRSEMYARKVNLFGGEPLGIFQPLDSKVVGDSSGPELTTWKWLQQRELKLAVTHPPSNIFEEMILWTEQGKLWKFPIDNEQGLDEEAKVYFTEHVFLERHLEPWCPRQGPIRHFMELVCVGLSKNPYITVQAKRDHIDWFRQYFEKKQDLLKEVGVLGDVSSQKNLEA